ncbi:MAG: tRNA (N6-isopentenyl adenosine(37)-C2)-methylthiotransferase MiaB [Saprospiraceae bacterium]|nr:tRNA (N6-isopentenyl adenosine(37)-C2)-methylthiotransferase MiaB [Saprospiraceae bacterium]MBK8369898.1 tRNA (N6-isopentenyl adenosine(37)-C2)-methylthiotransferase MiaB [Saprospiraceae bacterium]MBK8548272.1 tRNA (N6-isopentenyl adenosine(37)-C2)-methylthiotransferase MiaB [Saprospiraceae bacterium]MBK8855811.1 tRNA (N6-isopentenyl adenosine(37)-C2)-methylthiotransferase MiaB [Saprospiraceae bacterium]
MYDDNITLSGVKNEILTDKQGEVLFYQSDLPQSKKFYIESYGCQMNFSDSEIVASILAEEGYSPTREMELAQLILVNTCSIREKAEDTVRQRLTVFNKFKKDNPGVMIGVLGCMAERMKSKLLEEEKLVDIVVGPDAYRDLPKLLQNAGDGQQSINVLLSREETYADIAPLRLESNGVVAFISIMRGCDNMCSFCVVPFTRGRERSRDVYSILSEAEDLFSRGYRDITLLGQNVDSYKWENPDGNEKINFASLLEKVAKINPALRVRFTTSHPKDITDEVLLTIKNYPNICKYIHLPVQSGNSRILELMNRTYDSHWYKERVEAIYRIIPDCAISSDIITGFCSETEDEHRETLEMMSWANYSMSYMFFYSERPGTLAARKFKDDIPEEIKKRRLNEIVELQRNISLKHNLKDVGKTFEVLIEGDSKKSDQYFKGRNSQNKMVVFPKLPGLKPGDYVYVDIHEANAATLKGKVLTK